MLAQSGSFSSPFAVALASQLQGGFHSLASHLQHISSLSAQSTPLPTRKRIGGSSLKTAKVWKYFDQLPSEEQAAQCQLCRKKIKATNSRYAIAQCQECHLSTTGMIRHLRSCHVNEYQQLQEARQSCLLSKMEEKARAQLLREMTSSAVSVKLSPHSASDSGASDSSSSAVRVPSPMHNMFGFLRNLPAGLPAPKPILGTATIKMEVETAAEDEKDDQPTDLSVRSSVFASVSSMASSTEQKKSITTVLENFEEKKINTQVALMLLLDSQPSTLVDRPGFRGFIKMILPSHNLPTSEQFDLQIIPDVVTRLKADISSQFSLNKYPSSPATVPPSPVDSLHLTALPREHEKVSMSSDTTRQQMTGVDQVRAAMRAASNISRSFSHSIEIRREEDSDSSSSADSETAMPGRIDSFLDHIGRYVFPHEELIALLAICRAWFAHFEETGGGSSAGFALPPRVPGRPDLARDVAFVAENVDRLNAYAAAHPEADILPVSEHQAQFIKDLHAHINAL